MKNNSHCLYSSPCVIIRIEAKKKMHDTSIITMGIITDYQIHRFWLYPRIDYYCVPNMEMKEELLQMGWDDDCVQVTGIPCPRPCPKSPRADDLVYASNSVGTTSCLPSNELIYRNSVEKPGLIYESSVGKPELIYESNFGKHENQLDMKEPFCLVAGGGWGLSNLEETTYSLLKSFKLQSICCYRKNRALFKRLKLLERKNPDRLTVQGTIPNMFSIMSSASVVLQSLAA